MVELYVLALLCIDDSILLLRRHNASFANGLYSLPGGKVEQEESARKAIQREIQEETGLTIPQADFELMHTLSRKGTESPFIALFFKVDIAKMPKPMNKEPEKHDDLQFFKIDQLPTNIIPAHKQALELIQKKIAYSEHGW